MGTKLQFSIAYHPQTNCQSKRTIQTLEDMLHAYVLDFKTQWDESLPLSEFACNNNYHSTLGWRILKHCMAGDAELQCVGKKSENAAFMDRHWLARRVKMLSSFMNVWKFLEAHRKDLHMFEEETYNSRKGIKCFWKCHWLEERWGLVRRASCRRDSLDRMRFWAALVTWQIH